jgi:uncharacterized membrane protein YtjA (UPF0391 family)
MVHWSAALLLSAFICGILGSGCASSDSQIARVLSLCFLMTFFVSLGWDLWTDRRPPIPPQ